MPEKVPVFLVRFGTLTWKLASACSGFIKAGNRVLLWVSWASCRHHIAF